MENANEALRRSDDALKRIEALEDRLDRAMQLIELLGRLTSMASADVADLRIALGEPIP
jgi:hypothetical protein